MSAAGSASRMSSLNWLLPATGLACAGSFVLGIMWSSLDAPSPDPRDLLDYARGLCARSLENNWVKHGITEGDGNIDISVSCKPDFKTEIVPTDPPKEGTDG